MHYLLPARLTRVDATRWSRLPWFLRATARRQEPA
jgi:hypothetical protein